MARNLPGQFAILFTLLVGVAWGLALTWNRTDLLPDGVEGQRVALQRFIDHHGDVCSVAWSQYVPRATAVPEPTLESLVNASDAVVIARPVKTIMWPVQQNPGINDASVPGAFFSPIGTAMQVDEVVAGTSPGKTFRLEGGLVLSSVTGTFLRQSSGPDPCAPGQVLLFLYRFTPGTYFVTDSGWARVEGNAITTRPAGSAFARYQTADALIRDVESVYAKQQASGLPKGRLVCESSHATRPVLSALPCPGDTINPYETFHLGPTTSIMISTPDGGQHPLPALPTGSSVADILHTLDLQTEVYAFDLANVGREDAWLNQEGQLGLGYSHTNGAIIIFGTNGQFAAPPAFEEAMKPFLATAPAQ